MKKAMWLLAGATMSLAAPLAAEEPPSGPLVVNGGLMIWTVFVFVLLFLTLRRFAWPAILEAVEAREAALERQLADAEKNRAEAAALLEEQKRLLGEARTQAQGLIAEAKATAEVERAAAIEKTRHEQEELLARARREIASERDKALVELRREAVDLSLAAASKLIGQRLDATSDRLLVENYLKSLGSSH
jgi:F-type H+-transporting ATPase subunit b